MKGDTSGHQQWVKSVALDCDGDALVVKVDQVGAACHTGDRTCFDADVLEAVTGVTSNRPRPRTEMSVMRREFALVLLRRRGRSRAGRARRRGRPWAQAIFTAPRPLPAQDFSVTGQALVPLAGALALAALACLAAVIATRSVARRAVGALLAVLGAGRGGRRDNRGAGLGRARRGEGERLGRHPRRVDDERQLTRECHARDRHRGSSGHAVMAGAPWRAAAVVGAVVIILAGVATVWRGPRWPVMSARFDRPGAAAGAGRVAPPDRPVPRPCGSR